MGKMSYRVVDESGFPPRFGGPWNHVALDAAEVFRFFQIDVSRKEAARLLWELTCAFIEEYCDKPVNPIIASSNSRRRTQQRQEALICAAGNNAKLHQLARELNRLDLDESGHNRKVFLENCIHAASAFTRCCHGHRAPDLINGIAIASLERLRDYLEAIKDCWEDPEFPSPDVRSNLIEVPFLTFWSREPALVEWDGKSSWWFFDPYPKEEIEVIEDKEPEGKEPEFVQPRRLVVQPFIHKPGLPLSVRQKSLQGYYYLKACRAMFGKLRDQVDMIGEKIKSGRQGNPLENLFKDPSEWHYQLAVEFLCTLLQPSSVILTSLNSGSGKMPGRPSKYPRRLCNECREIWDKYSDETKSKGHKPEAKDPRWEEMLKSSGLYATVEVYREGKQPEDGNGKVDEDLRREFQEKPCPAAQKSLAVPALANILGATANRRETRRDA
ncbi:MAG: hypothetical protein KDA99_17715 [Planctomycetales bacterium]|nr:hypothetical protein [Planctomycetales bacterium]